MINVNKKKKPRVVIIGGAHIADYDRVKTYLRDDDYAVFCDSGLKHLEALNIQPDLILGDFDSFQNPNLEIETIVLPCEKDDTDTFFAAKEMTRRGYDDFLLIGVIGGRLDHSLGNISILLHLDELGKQACIVDDYSEMSVISDQPVRISDDCDYFSLLNVSGIAKGIEIQNAKYPLINGEIHCSYQYGISNEVLPGKEAVVSVDEGKLLLIKVWEP